MGKGACACETAKTGPQGGYWYGGSAAGAAFALFRVGAVRCAAVGGGAYSAVPAVPGGADVDGFNMAIAVWNVRLPCILLACLVGCALSAAGASYQTVFQNHGRAGHF